MIQNQWIIRSLNIFCILLVILKYWIHNPIAFSIITQTKVRCSLAQTLFLCREQKSVLLPAMMMMIVVGKNLSLPSTSYGPISGRKDISHAHNNFLEIGLSSPFLNRTFLLQVQRKEESFLMPLTRRSKLPQKYNTSTTNFG